MCIMNFLSGSGSNFPSESISAQNSSSKRQRVESQNVSVSESFVNSESSLSSWSSSAAAGTARGAALASSEFSSATFASASASTSFEDSSLAEFLSSLYQKSFVPEIPSFRLITGNFLSISVDMECVLWQVTNVEFTIATIQALDIRHNFPDRKIHWETQHLPMTDVDEQVVMAKARLSNVERLRYFGIETNYVTRSQDSFVVSALLQLGVQISTDSIQGLRFRVADCIKKCEELASDLGSFFFQSMSDFDIYVANLKSGQQAFSDVSVWAFARAFQRNCVVLTLDAGGVKPPTATKFPCDHPVGSESPTLLFTFSTDLGYTNGHFEMEQLSPGVSLSQFGKAWYDYTTLGQVARFQAADATLD